jgi:COP9 signalosome complex subunit 6
LSLLIPADAAAFEHELMSEQNDVNLVSLLSSITQSIKEVRETGRKFAVVDSAKTSKSKGNGAGSAWGSPFNVPGIGDIMN